MRPFRNEAYDYDAIYAERYYGFNPSEGGRGALVNLVKIPDGLTVERGTGREMPDAQRQERSGKLPTEA